MPYIANVFVREVIEIGLFRDILPDKFVLVLDCTFLPGAVAVGEVYGHIRHPAHPTIRAISFLGVFLCSKAKICDLCCEVNCLYISNTKLMLISGKLRFPFFILYYQCVMLQSALGGGLNRPRRRGIPRQKEGEE